MYFRIGLLLNICCLLCIPLTQSDVNQASSIWRQDDPFRANNQAEWVLKFQREAKQEKNYEKYFAVGLQSPITAVTIYIQAGQERDKIQPFQYNFSQTYIDQSGQHQEEKRSVCVLKYSENTIEALKNELSAIKDEFRGKHFLINIFQCKICGKCNRDSQIIRTAIDEVFDEKNLVNVIVHKHSILPTPEILQSSSFPKEGVRPLEHSMGIFTAGVLVTLTPIVANYLWKNYKKNHRTKKNSASNSRSKAT